MSTVLSPMPLEGGLSPAPASGYRPGGMQPYPRPLTNDRARRKHAAIALLSTLVTAAMLTVIAFHAYIAWTLAHPYVAPLYANPKLAAGLDYRDVAFPSASGRTTVHGWYIPAPVLSERTVVFSHGYGANREETWVPMYELAELLHGLRYNVMMFDYGYASSAHRSPATGGVEESQELLASIRYAKSQGASEIVVWGFSMGAGTALQAALQTDDITAMILDSMFLTDSDTLYHNISQLMPLPRYPSLMLIEKLMPLWSGIRLDDIPAERVKTTDYRIPIYLMHGTDDNKAPVGNAEAIAARQTHPLSGSWVVSGGKHELLFQVHPKEYIERAAVFLAQVHRQAAAEAAAAA